MSYFIIIRGPADVGKTTIANEIAKSLQGYHISFDNILAKHGLDYVPGDLCVPEHKMLAANKIVIPMSQEKLAAGQIVIFDGNFYHQSTIVDLITQLHFPHLVYTLKANLEICIARNKMRSNQLDEQAVRDVFALSSANNCGTVIDTNNKTIAQIVDEMISDIADRKKLS